MMEAWDISLCLGGRTVLDGITLSVAPGEVVGVIGANGAGKSSLLRVLAGMAAPATGGVSVAGQPLGVMGERERARAIGYLPQHPQCDWPLSVHELAALGRLPHLAWWQGVDAAAETAEVKAALHACGMAGMARRCVDTLSGGEFARAMLARLLAGRADVLIADEPVADLDPPHRVRVMEILRGEAARGAAVITALHDLALADAACDRVIVMGQGRVLADGAPANILTEGLLARAYGAPVRVDRHKGQLVAVFGAAADGRN